MSTGPWWPGIEPYDRRSSGSGSNGSGSTGSYMPWGPTGWNASGQGSGSTGSYMPWGPAGWNSVGQGSGSSGSYISWGSAGWNAGIQVPGSSGSTMSWRPEKWNYIGQGSNSKKPQKRLDSTAASRSPATRAYGPIPAVREYGHMAPAAGEHETTTEPESTVQETVDVVLTTAPPVPVGTNYPDVHGMKSRP
eukprot:5102622-Amphidinium_carterae.2